jgi:glyoxylase-like metal-dependent hydrolase (beta-lactamase superfamily II)
MLEPHLLPQGANTLIFESVAVGPLQCNCYVIGCEQSREALLIDPGDEADRILPLLNKHQLEVKYILSTHAHIDHVGDLEKMKEITGAKALLHERDLVLYQNLAVQAAWLGVSVPGSTQIDNLVSQGDKVRFGKHSADILFTPGHTPGSICLHLQEDQGLLFSGDTLFHRSIGRTDLWGGSQEAIFKSIQEQLLSLGDQTVVYPGHGQPTTIGQERRLNPFLQFIR